MQTELGAFWLAAEQLLQRAHLLRQAYLVTGLGLKELFHPPSPVCFQWRWGGLRCVRAKCWCVYIRFGYSPLLMARSA